MNTAPVKWAQRKDSLYLTITLSDVKDHKIDLSDKKLTFEGTSNDKRYSVVLDFFKEIEAEGSVWNVLPSSVQMKLNKKNKDEEFWPRLLQDKNLEKTNVKIDWDRYVDEDEADGNDFDMDALGGGMDFGGMDFGGMGGMPGMGGMGGMGMPGMGGMDMGGMGDDEDSDDDENLPDLEATDSNLPADAPSDDN